MTDPFPPAGAPGGAPPDPRLVAVLRASQAFGQLGQNLLEEIAARLEMSPVSGGAQVLREGEIADTMVILVSGRLRVSRRDPSGELRLYNEITPGETVGEIALILRQPRTADVTAVRDSVLGVLHRDDFEWLLSRHPVALNRVFTQSVYNFLRHTPQAVRHRAQSLVVVPLDRQVDGHAFATALTRALEARGRSRHVTADVISGLEDATGRSHRVDEALVAMEGEFDFLVFEAQPAATSWTRRVFRQGDQVIFVASAHSAPAPAELERLLAQEPGYQMMRKHLALVHPSGVAEPVDGHPWREGRDLERVYLVRTGEAAHFASLARFLTGSAVGVVLGGGGARGFAHLGVLRALDEAGVAIDLVGGNSMGALIGANYVIGVPLDEIRERIVRFARGGERPTLPIVSLLAGRRMERDLRRMFGERCIERLWLPFFAAACNLSRATTTVQDSGPLWRAVLASNSPAGLLPPVPYKGDLLVDGAILDNVPVGAMRARLGTALERRRGNGTIIAIDVDLRQELSVDPRLERLPVWRTAREFITSKPGRLPAIGDILYGAGHIGGSHQRARTVAQADHYLEPPVAGFPLMAYRRAAEIVETGYRYAVEAIGRWDTRPR